MLWNGAPDGPLLQEVQGNRLGESAVLERQIQRMLADDRSQAFVSRFFFPWLALDKLAKADPDQKYFPDYDVSLRTSLARETELFLLSQLRDDRDPIEFASAHLAGSLNVPDSAAFDTWVAGVVDPERPIVLVTDAGREKDLATRLSRAGLPRASGYLDGGRRALRELPASIRRSSRASIDSLKTPCNDHRLILDTRPHGQKPLGPAVSGFGLPLGLLRGEIDVLPREFEILVCDDFPCRSSAAASLLRSRGFENVSEVGGGLALWGLSKRP